MAETLTTMVWQLQTKWEVFMKRYDCVRTDLDHFGSMRDLFFAPVERAFDRFFDEFWGAPRVAGYVKSNLHYPKIDAGIQGNEFVVTAAVPGVPQEQLKVEILPERIVRISGEMSEEYRSDDSKLWIKELCKRKFARELSLPENLVNDEPSATLKNGLLTLRWKLAADEEKLPQSKLIAITEG